MDDDQQFCLRWNNHQSTLISVFDTLLENETLVDCTLAAEGKFLKAHKVVLSACSPYFATLLQEQYDKHPIFILKDVKYQELRAMMDYMYRGEVNISQDQLAALLKAAESLQIKGLSDNRTGAAGGSGNAAAPRPEHHRSGGLNVPGTSGGKLSAGYTLEQTKRARVGPSSMDSQDMSGSREGSSSPSRRRRKVRRRSIDNAMADVHDNSNSSQIQTNQHQSSLLQQQQSNASLAGVGAITAAASALAGSQQQIPVSAAALPLSGTASGAATAAIGTIQAASIQGTTQQLTTSVTKKTESVKGTSDAMNTENVQAGSGAASTGVGADEQHEGIADHVKGEKQNHKSQKSSASSSVAVKESASSELVIEPKSEYDEEGNDETVEDLTLDDEDMGMDDLDHNAGTSQGGEGSSQGYAPWQHDRSQDELLLATQEAQQRDPQDIKHEFHSTLIIGENMNERFPCAVCGKSYLRKRHLQRHMRDECIGIPPRFSCELCPSRFRRKYHMVRHLTSKHGIPPAIAQKITGGSANCSGGAARGSIGCDGGSVGSGSQNGCDSPIPENLSLKKEHYEIEHVHSPMPMQVGYAINGGVGGGSGSPPIPPPHMPIPTYGLTGAITAISAAAAVVEETAAIQKAVEAAHATADIGEVGGLGGVVDAGGGGRGGAYGIGVVGGGETEVHDAAAAAIKAEPLTTNKAAALSMMDDDWKMKLSLQFISNSLLKERLMNSMPFAYKNN